MSLLGRLYRRKQPKKSLNIGLVVNTKDPEISWNAIRLGITSLNQGNTVNVFLIAHGVEILSNGDLIFDIAEKIEEFIDKGGKLLSCGTCLDLRKLDKNEICDISTMNDLLNIIEKSDRLLSFG